MEQTRQVSSSMPEVMLMAWFTSCRYVGLHDGLIWAILPPKVMMLDSKFVIPTGLLRAAGAQLLQLQRYTKGFKVGFNVVGSPEDFLATGGSNSTAFVFGRPHDRLPFADATFDTVLSMNILEHVQDLQVMAALNIQLHGAGCRSMLALELIEERPQNITLLVRAAGLVCSCTSRKPHVCCGPAGTCACPGTPAGRAPMAITYTRTW
jgi:hypothetical protein